MVGTPWVYCELTTRATEAVESLRSHHTGKVMSDLPFPQNKHIVDPGGSGFGGQRRLREDTILRGLELIRPHLKEPHSLDVGLEKREEGIPARRDPVESDQASVRVIMVLDQALCVPSVQVRELLVEEVAHPPVHALVIPSPAFAGWLQSSRASASAASRRTAGLPGDEFSYVGAQELVEGSGFRSLRPKTVREFGEELIHGGQRVPEKVRQHIVDFAAFASGVVRLEV